MDILDPESVDVALLPSVLFAEKRLLPSHPAIYFVLSAKNDVLYIGQTRSLKHRWTAHHLRKSVEIPIDARIAWLTLDEPRLLMAVEQALIVYFMPPWNRASGRPVRGKTVERFIVMLPPDLHAWAMAQPEGFSGLMRQLLQAERQRRESPQP